jgi:hypothetical protein
VVVQPPQASFELIPQTLRVQIAADQHQSISHWPEPSTLIQSEALADEMKYMPFFALGNPQHAFRAKHVVRKPF